MTSEQVFNKSTNSVNLTIECEHYFNRRSILLHHALSFKPSFTEGKQPATNFYNSITDVLNIEHKRGGV